MEINGRYGQAEDVKALKAHIRKQMLEKRTMLEEDYCLMADGEILNRVLAAQAYRKAKTIFIYVSTHKEVDTGKLIVRALSDGKKVAVPRCVEKGVMKAYRIRGTGDLEKGMYGILEPAKGCCRIKPEEMDLAVIPCVCCSESGLRMGYGGGYYDRYLSECRAVRMALCRERLMVKNMPGEAHDLSMDFVITEERVLEFS